MSAPPLPTTKVDGKAYRLYPDGTRDYIYWNEKVSLWTYDTAADGYVVGYGEAEDEAKIIRDGYNLKLKFYPAELIPSDSLKSKWKAEFAAWQKQKGGNALRLRFSGWVGSWMSERSYYYLALQKWYDSQIKKFQSADKRYSNSQKLKAEQAAQKYMIQTYGAFLREHAQGITDSERDTLDKFFLQWKKDLVSDADAKAIISKYVKGDAALVATFFTIPTMKRMQGRAITEMAVFSMFQDKKIIPEVANLSGFPLSLI